jgi:phospholipid/cholesterol/gamma-HCH transport system substrate-binding protein
MARKKTTLAQLRVGLLAAGTIVILIVFILSVTGDISPFKKTFRYKTRFVAADGLKEGDEVRLAGKNVGQVEQVAFAEGIPTTANEKPIVVTMRLKADDVGGRIRTDSNAVLGQQGFLGDRVIDITPGTSAAQAIPEWGEIASADQASLAQVFQGANDILVQFNRVGQQLQELMDNINTGKGTLGKFLHDDALYVNLNRTVVEGQSLVKSMKEGQGTIARLINDPSLYNDVRNTTNELQAMVTDLRAGKGTAGKLFTDEQLYRNANDAVAKANNVIEKLDRIAADIEAGRGTVGKLMKDEKLHEDLKATMASIRAISDRLEKGEGAAGKLLRDDRLYNNVNDLSAEMVKMLYDFRQNPRKYLSIKVTLF